MELWMTGPVVGSSITIYSLGRERETSSFSHNQKGMPCSPGRADQCGAPDPGGAQLGGVGKRRGRDRGRGGGREGKSEQ